MDTTLEVVKIHASWNYYELSLMDILILLFRLLLTKLEKLSLIQKKKKMISLYNPYKLFEKHFDTMVPNLLYVSKIWDYMKLIIKNLNLTKNSFEIYKRNSRSSLVHFKVSNEFCIHTLWVFNTKSMEKTSMWLYTVWNFLSS